MIGTPIEPVNIFLMSLHIDDEIEEWRRGELESDWFVMPARKSKRSPYLYRKALKDLVPPSSKKAPKWNTDKSKGHWQVNLK